MRSSNKSRSRNKNSNRSRGVGNVVNRVFDSAGPEGKVRGTPQQIIEKYQTLARDAQLSGDRVAAENFQQHAEHYTRLLNDAQREQAERQAAENRNRPQQQSQTDEQPQQDGDTGQQPQPAQEASSDRPAQKPRRNGASRAKDTDATEVLGGEPDSGLVETPESAKQQDDGVKAESDSVQAQPEAEAEAEKPAPRPRASRGRPRKSAAKKDTSAEAELPLDRPADTPVQ